jgi:hypothetical protein
MKDVLTPEDLNTALGNPPTSANPAMTLKGLAETVSHNAQTAAQITSNLAAEITMTNLVLKALISKLEIDPEEITEVAAKDFTNLSKLAESMHADHPTEATVFGER